MLLKLETKSNFHLNSVQATNCFSYFVLVGKIFAKNMSCVNMNHIIGASFAKLSPSSRFSFAFMSQILATAGKGVETYPEQDLTGLLLLTP